MLKENLSFRAKIARFFGVHCYINGICRGCGCSWSAHADCDWGMEQEQWVGDEENYYSC
jgi:hypothetical protein